MYNVAFVQDKKFCETYVLYHHIYCVYQGKMSSTPKPEAGKPPLPQSSSPKIPAGRIEKHHYDLFLFWKIL